MSLISEGADFGKAVDSRLAEPSLATVGDYLALLKPRVMSLVIFTALVGLAVAPGSIHPLTAFTALLCIAVGAGASGALNMWYDADIDALMTRTARRPVPAGRVKPGEALAFGLTLSAFAVVVLGLLVNLLSAALLAFTIFFYAVVYTMWLKRSTPQNIVIGGAAGAFPPMIGWAAVTGSLSLEPVLLFSIIFFWTPPHFWALAICKTKDYARAGIPMLPVVVGRRRHASANPALHAHPGAARHLALPARLCRPSLRRDRRRDRRDHAFAGRAHLPRAAAGRSRLPASVRFLDSVSVSSVRGSAGRPWLGRADCPVNRVRLDIAMTEPNDDNGSSDGSIVLTEAQKRARRSRSIAIAVSLAALVVLFYVMTLVKGPAILIRPL